MASQSSVGKGGVLEAWLLVLALDLCCATFERTLLL